MLDDFQLIDAKFEYFDKLNIYPLGDVQFPEMLEELSKAEKFIFLEY